MKTLNTEINECFLLRMRKILTPCDYTDYLNALNNPPLRIARKNPLKEVSDELIKSENGDFPTVPVSAKPGKGALYAAGAYYVQEPAAAAVAEILPPMLPDGANVLDMCAAPGGKVTAAASLRPDCNFLANEVIFSRAKILLSNVERLGLRNCTVTSLRPDEVACRGENLFDAVIADVPCSGEGMLRKAEFYSSDLSDDTVTACAERAKKILNECDRCLRPGGLLLFSTCTFNTTENEEQVFYLMREKGYETVVPYMRPPLSRKGFNVDDAVRFFPQDGGGEGHFACVLRKPENAATKTFCKKTKNANSDKNRKIISALNTCAKISAEKFDVSRTVIIGDGCEYLPVNYAFSAFPALRRGMRLVDFSGDRFVPHHHFATAATASLLINSPNYSPDANEIRAYLAGCEFECNEKDGFRVLKVASVPLGLIKISGGIAKNKYPKGLRVF